MESRGTWFHGTKNNFEEFKTRVAKTFGEIESETPLFFSRSKDFAKMYAGNSGTIISANLGWNKIFDSKRLIKPSNKYFPPQREGMTPEGQRLYDDLEEGKIFGVVTEEEHWGVFGDSYGLLASILKHDYDTIETSEFKEWLKRSGYDAAIVRGDGEDNVFVFSPSQIKIVGKEIYTMKNEFEQLAEMILDEASSWPRRNFNVNGKEARGITSGNFGIVSDGGPGNGYFTLVHLKSGKTIFTGTRTYYSAGNRVPVDIGGFKLEHMKYLAGRLEEYIGKDEFSKILAYIQNEDPESAGALSIQSTSDVDNWISSALGDGDDGDDDPFLSFSRTVDKNKGRIAEVLLNEYVKYDNQKFNERWKGEGSPFKDEIGESGEKFTDWLEQKESSGRLGNKLSNIMQKQDDEEAMMEQKITKQSLENFLNEDIENLVKEVYLKGADVAPKSVQEIVEQMVSEELDRIFK